MSVSRNRGFTLIELLVVIAIIGILAGWAVPSFSQLAARNALDRQADRLWQAISATRLEAAERRATVHLCPSEDDSTCTNDWQNGLIMFEDADDDAILDGGETLIRRYPANVGAIRITNNSNQSNGFSYQPTGFTTEPGTFDLCHPDLKSGNARQIVTSFGRVRRARDDNADC
ncbi:GspH/FimT family pseudopilin [Halomonas sp. HP20-15]|uniref:GspH/FimT family pseudopilin n=1 Tax=Halomonas sp. HP20-15 TaxID=3085901 RepID=UPI002980C072|nr:GspH/FimT family pseudopilin [Halomonas sp. HP20-15]MDW5376197.1 GspH/FimT family pseudopilin [Halomonas sp. HP20-15]